MVDIRINDRPMKVSSDTTILEAARQAGITIPTLCHMEQRPPLGACRVCVVEVKHAPRLMAACATPVAEGMEIFTNTKRVRDGRRSVLELLLSEHNGDCRICVRSDDCELRKIAANLDITKVRYEGELPPARYDDSTPALRRDTEKCIKCRRCITMCTDVQGVGALAPQKRGYGTEIGPAFSLDLGDVACVQCGQCAAACPVGAIIETSHVEDVWHALEDPEKHVVVQTAPAIRAALGECFGYPPGTRVTGKMVAALRGMGFDAVFDTNFAADLTILEEGHELLERLKHALVPKETVGAAAGASQEGAAGGSAQGHGAGGGFNPRGGGGPGGNGSPTGGGDGHGGGSSERDGHGGHNGDGGHGPGPLPLITSCSPGWIKHAELFFPDLLPNLSTCKSPQQMFGALAKTYYAQNAEVDPANMVVVSAMPCTAKKFEAARPEMRSSGYQDVDYVITTRELGRMITSSGLSFDELEDDTTDSPLGQSSGAADIFANTGGVMEAALRTVWEVVTGSELPGENLHFQPAQGLTGVKEAEATIAGTKPEFSFLEGVTVRIAVAHGLGNASKLLSEVRRDPSRYHFIEIMACPGGCIGGGGQPRPTTDEVREARIRGIYAEDEGKPLRKSHENPDVAKLYSDYLERPLGPRSHELLHTHYERREV